MEYIKFTLQVIAWLSAIGSVIYLCAYIMDYVPEVKYTRGEMLNLFIRELVISIWAFHLLSKYL